MIVLDPLQALALRKSATGPVGVAGRRGTGKSVLANAIASETARAGRTCLLIGASEVLERPLGFAIVREIHRVLAERAQISHVSADSAATPMAPASAIEARARTTPDAARAAILILEKARALARTHNLTAGEIESSAAANRGHSATTLNSLSLAAQDAARVADVLWTGNARAGRTFRDVGEAIAGRAIEVPPDDAALDLIRAGDAEYKTGIAKIVSNQKEADEERAVSKAVASLLRPRSTDRSLADYQKHAAFMAHTISTAISLIRRHGNLKATLAASSGSDAAKAIEYFMRMKPDQGTVTAVRTFEAALQDYRQDSALLEPFVAEYGSRPLASFGAAASRQTGRAVPDVARLVQLLREARYAARHLPGHLGLLRASMPKPAFERLLNSPIEEAPTALGAAGGTLEPRAKAADEARQLRDLFASTGFGDMLNAPEDFARQIEQASLAVPAAEPASGPSYSPGVLDLLLDLTSLAERPADERWPAAVRRARTASDALAALAQNRFDVVVIDDASGFPADSLAQIKSFRPTVHLLGIAEDDRTISLEIPHRQTDPEVAAAASGEPNRWLGEPGGFGVLVREDEGLDAGGLSAAAERLAAELRREGCSASASGSEAADVVVAAFDKLHDADLAGVAQRAAHGVVILCRKDLRSASSPAEPPQSADAQAAQSLGWKISRAATEGTVLDKGGRTAVLVEEKAHISAHDETVADVSQRLKALGWAPVISWSGTERGPEDLSRLLAAHSRPLAPNRFRSVAEALDLRGPPPDGGGHGPDFDERGDAEPEATEVGEAPHHEAGVGITTEIPEVLTPEHAATGDRGETAVGSPAPAEDASVEAAVSQPDSQAIPPQSSPETEPPTASKDDLSGAAEPADDYSAREEAAPEEHTAGHSSEAQNTDAAPSEPQGGEDTGPRPRAVFRDRRGARRHIPQREEAGPRRERRATSRLRQAEAKLRLMVDPIRKRIALAAILQRPEGFPDLIRIGGEDVQNFDDSRYDDLDLDWTTGLLDGEIRFSDETQKLEWVRSARPFHLFTGAPGEPDLISVSAAPLGTRCTIVCRERHAADIEATATEAGSSAPARLSGFEGLPSGWTVLDGYVPVRALVSPPEWLKPLDPGAEMAIALDGGFEIKTAVYAEGEPPLIRIDGMPSNCKVFIDGSPAQIRADRSWSAPGWDKPGAHLVDIVPGKTLTYHIMPDPALRDGWERWTAHTSLAPALSGAAAICGAMVYSPDGRTVLATEAASSVTALGARHEIKMLPVRQDAPAAIAALSFEPLFAVLSSGGRREQSRILVLDFPQAASERQPKKLDARWAFIVRDMAARRVQVRPETPAAKAAWRSATQEARRRKRAR
ncbi:hypothetical protein JQ557_05830 [Bradyrhizobium sp. U87765 SZCCT0131]|uniref:ATP-binding protein n=1 Tax=unclassified Bradyrhizobium TaxID=2631580 RepID=UPI001BA90781|nr:MULTISPECIES: ATP-binding protein [unclassified Bradyrhizobium]MBR1217496.1 hypothetical protein [Bradyrhizobium sp. U87765 SZCCT0131]MBR1264906.1 hypothetical protein [Bradyrhizobium sp. U87765 SZCCT0134]MBR1304888.1 hypothetical protein [Bradyrhizobium sp. U87765 SZCCT0110]MBR1320675.1 hypothetical protein [Bradyrhizobium sp. U87765 SZCCT0109]MBR1349095.1 hypothetical protein [Bradyrhizobium sp. U87765 SZCCT0048]